MGGLELGCRTAAQQGQSLPQQHQAQSCLELEDSQLPVLQLVGLAGAVLGRHQGKCYCRCCPHELPLEQQELEYQHYLGTLCYYM